MCRVSSTIEVKANVGEVLGIKPVHMLESIKL